MSAKAVAAKAIRRVVPRPVRNWLRDPRQTLEWVGDSVAFAAGRTIAVDLADGWTVSAHPLAARRAYFAQLADAVQRRELDGFIAACTPGMQLLDLGAHFGVFSLAALHFGGPAARAVAVDPSPTAARMLAIQARLNGVADRMAIVQACVSDTVGTGGMLDTGVIGAGYFVPVVGDTARPDATSVEVVTIDALCERHRVAPTHIKIDVEGAELEVLAGGRGVILSARPALFVEIHGDMLRARRQDPQSVVDVLRGWDYLVEDVAGEPLPSALDRDVCRVVARP